MFDDIPIPFTGQKIDASTDGALTFGAVVLGFAALYMAQDLGASIKSTASETIGFGNEGQAPDVL